MIDAKEIKLNNWVYGRHSEGWIEMQLTEDVLEVLFGARNYADYNPIPLTPEILEKAGFATDEERLFYRLNFQYEDSTYPCYMIYGTDKEYIQICRNHTAAADAPFKYLHQLQNLYFSLTGTELQITL